MKQISVAFLKRHNACGAQVRQFRRVFGERATLSAANVDKALNLDMPFIWLWRVLDPARKRVFERAQQESWIEHDRLRVQAYDKKITNAYTVGSVRAHADYMAEEARIYHTCLRQRAMALLALLQEM